MTQLDTMIEGSVRLTKTYLNSAAVEVPMQTRIQTLPNTIVALHERAPSYELDYLATGGLSQAGRHGNNQGSTIGEERVG